MKMQGFMVGLLVAFVAFGDALYGAKGIKHLVGKGNSIVSKMAEVGGLSVCGAVWYPCKARQQGCLCLLPMVATHPCKRLWRQGLLRCRSAGLLALRGATWLVLLPKKVECMDR